MSHKATTWLADVKPSLIGHSEFRVLFQLCDCHNPAQGCFPTQAYLSAHCGMSRSTINVALASLEEKGLIRRHQSVDEATRRQRPTRYILGFEMSGAQEPCPETGHGKGAAASGKNSATRVRSAGRGTKPKPCPETGPGAVSGIQPEPCPENGKSRVRPTGHKPVIEPVREPGAATSEEEFLRKMAEHLNDPSRPFPASALSRERARAMIRMDLVTAEALEARGIDF